MKHLLIATILGLTAVLPALSAKEAGHLFILSGQSNMAALDPSQSFTPTVAAAFGEEQVTIVKGAWGGQPIRRWYKQWQADDSDPEATGASAVTKEESYGDLYDVLMAKVAKATSGKEFSSVTFVWMQGERDAREGHGDVYAQSLRGVLQQLADDLGRQDINVVIGRLSDFDMANAQFPDWTLVRDVLVEVAESEAHGAWIDTDDLNDGLNHSGAVVKNDLHFSAEGYEVFGRRLADAAIQLIQKAN
ncbi:sialate O-acetylesterase [Coraliomargarita sp. W4R53]